MKMKMKIPYWYRETLAQQNTYDHVSKHIVGVASYAFETGSAHPISHSGTRRDMRGICDRAEVYQPAEGSMTNN